MSEPVLNKPLPDLQQGVYFSPFLCSNNFSYANANQNSTFVVVVLLQWTDLHLSVWTCPSEGSPWRFPSRSFLRWPPAWPRPPGPVWWNVAALLSSPLSSCQWGRSGSEHTNIRSVTAQCSFRFFFYYCRFHSNLQLSFQSITHTKTWLKEKLV